MKPAGRSTRVSLVIVAIATAGCGGGAPAATDPGSGGEGASLYAVNCAACHGARAEGSAIGPALVDDRYLIDVFPDAGFVGAVELGVPEPALDFGPMPAVPGLDHSEIAEITAYIRSLQSS